MNTLADQVSTLWDVTMFIKKVTLRMSKLCDDALIIKHR